MNEPVGSPGLQALADELAGVLESSRPIPLVRQVRVDKQAVYDLVAKMRELSGAGLLEAAEAVEDAVYRALPMPLTDEVRLPTERVEELARGLRAAAAYAPGRPAPGSTPNVPRHPS